MPATGCGFLVSPHSHQPACCYVATITPPSQNRGNGDPDIHTCCSWGEEISPDQIADTEPPQHRPHRRRTRAAQDQGIHLFRYRLYDTCLVRRYRSKNLCAQKEGAPCFLLYIYTADVCRLLYPLYLLLSSTTFCESSLGPRERSCQAVPSPAFRSTASLPPGLLAA